MDNPNWLSRKKVKDANEMKLRGMLDDPIEIKSEPRLFIEEQGHPGGLLQ
jgi:hypothetical protein